MKNNALRTCVARTFLVIFFMTIVPLKGVSAINPNIPDLLVNTESFQAIDSGDGTSTIDMQFGTSTKTLKLLTTNIFQFNKSLSVVGSISGSSLTIDGVSSFSGASMVKGTLTSRSTVSGANLTFMGAASSYILGSVGIGKSAAPKAKFDVLGTISGSNLTISNNGSFSGSLIVKNSLSGSSFYGANLGDCNNATNSKLIYNQTTGKFGCGSDQTGAGGLTFTNAEGIYVNQAGDTMTGALTINVTGGVSTTIGLKLINALSGAILHAEKTLTSSGFLMVTQQTIQGSGALVVRQLRNSTGAMIIGSGSHITSPLLALDSSTGAAKAPHILFGYLGNFDVSLYRTTGAVLRTNANFLRVTGTISGAQLRANNMTISGAVVYSSGNLLKQTAKGLSGQLLISQGTSAPVWKPQKTSLVWYLDSTVAVGTNQSAIVTMPFGLLASTGSLRIKGAPTGSSLTVDLRKDNVSIFSTQPSILAGATVGGKQMVLSTTNLTEGSEISLTVTQVGSTFAGSGLTIMLTGTRKY